MKKYRFSSILLLLATTKPLVGRGYLYPLIPLNKEVLFRMVFRVKLKQKENALFPILVTLSGIAMLVRLRQ